VNAVVDMPVYPVNVWFKYNGGSEQFKAGFNAASTGAARDSASSREWLEGFDFEQQARLKGN
jgi:hypothetical protein